MTTTINTLFASFANVAASLGNTASVLADLNRSLDTVATLALAEKSRVETLLADLPNIPDGIASSPLADNLGLSQALADLKTARVQLGNHAGELEMLAVEASVQANDVRNVRLALVSVAAVVKADTPPTQPAALQTVSSPSAALEESSSAPAQTAPLATVTSQPTPAEFTLPSWEDLQAEQQARKLLASQTAQEPAATETAPTPAAEPIASQTLPQSEETALVLPTAAVDQPHDEQVTVAALPAVESVPVAVLVPEQPTEADTEVKPTAKGKGRSRTRKTT